MQQHQHRLLPCPIGPTSLTTRHSSRGIDRKPLHESAPESEAYRRATGCRSRRIHNTHTHTTQETGSGIDERESEPTTLPSFLAKPCPGKLSEEAPPVYHNCISRRPKPALF